MGGKLRASLLLIAMFGLGVLTGAAVQNYRMSHFGHGAFATRRVQWLTRELKLTPAQSSSVQDIFSQAHERARQVNEEVSWDLDDIHRDSVRAIREILTPEQQKRFDQMHERLHRHHHDAG